MAVQLYPGSEVQRGDLCAFFQGSCGARTNVYSITYSLYFVDPGPPESEVLIGAANRTPVNPEIGEYYAALYIPPSAIVGQYRIRWSFKESNDTSAPQEIVMEFEVLSRSVTGACQYSQCITELMRRLRIHLRDHCVAGEELVLVDVAGEKMQVSLEELWEAIHA
jgi:hypothetical protein